MDVAASLGPAAHRRQSGVHPSGCISAHMDGRQLPSICRPPATGVRCSPALHMHVQPKQNCTNPPSSDSLLPCLPVLQVKSLQRATGRCAAGWRRQLAQLSREQPLLLPASRGSSRACLLTITW